MIDTRTGVYQDFEQVAVSLEVAEALGFHNCVFRDANYACVGREGLAAAGHQGITSDIVINGSDEAIYRDPLDIPGDDNDFHKDDVRFNACGTSTTVAYEVLVHEAGHVLGTRRFSGLDPAHPTTFDSVIHPKIRSYVPACSPHPLDIMAIYALYQNTD